MSLSEALKFISAARRDAALKAAIDAATNTGELHALAAAQGYRFEPAELERAFVNDWTMRWMAKRKTN